MKTALFFAFNIIFITAMTPAITTYQASNPGSIFWVFAGLSSMLASWKLANKIG